MIGAPESYHTCPTCVTPVAPGCIVTDRPVFDVRQGYSVVRTFLCEPCHQLITWRESSTSNGEPTGQLLSGPGIVRSAAAVRRFIAAHPTQTEVLVA